MVNKMSKMEYNEEVDVLEQAEPQRKTESLIQSSLGSRDEIARRLLDRCEQLEKSKRLIDESVRSHMNEMNVNNNGSPMDIDAYRTQLEQCSRTLMSSQENTRLKQEKYQSEIGDLKSQLEDLKAQTSEMQNAEQNWILENMSLKLKVAEASDWVKKAQKHLTEVHAENVRLKKYLLALKNGEVVLPSARPPSSNSDTKENTKLFALPEKNPAENESTPGGARRLLQNWSLRLNSTLNIPNRDSLKPMNEVTTTKHAFLSTKKTSSSDDFSIGSLTDETSSIAASLEADDLEISK